MLPFDVPVDAPLDLAAVPLLLAVLLYVGLAPAWRPDDARARRVVTGVALVLLARYVWWRVAATLWPVEPAWSAQYAWVVVYFLCECVLLVDAAVHLVLVSRTVDRRPEADVHEAWLGDRMATPDGRAALPTVDVLVATYNEGWDVLERTIVAALVLDYPHVTVHVCDDGARDWLRERCEALGARYVRRADRAHAKAGNINHALGVTSGDLVLVLDADFVPQRDFLRRTVGFFRDPTVGIVQAPHHFFNADPLQTNLGLHQRYSDDQEYFFGDVMPARDAWGVAFCCGSNGVLRRRALAAIGGGIPTASITEDMLTSFALLQRGLRTVYLNERLARGLAPEGLAAMYTQRARWARGGVQLMHLPDGPLRGRGVPLGRRVFFSPVAWIASNVALPTVVFAPALFLWGGLVAVPESTAAGLLAYQLPMLLAVMGAVRWTATVRRHPLVTLAYQLFQSYRLMPAVLHALVRPFAVGFQVTPKGALARAAAGHAADGGRRVPTVDVRAVALTLGMIGLTVGGMVVNALPSWEHVPADAFLTPSIAWGTLTVAVMLVCLLMAFEWPRRRTEERFVIDETHAATVGGARRPVPARVLNVSLSGAAVRLDASRDADGAAIGGAVALPAVGTPCVLHLRDVGDLPARVARHAGGAVVGVHFDALGDHLRWYLIAKIYAHGYESHGKHERALGTLRALGGTPEAAYPALARAASRPAVRAIA